MTDRATLEARATELGIKFTENWKDETLENRIAAQEKANDEAAKKDDLGAENAQTPSGNDQANEVLNGASVGDKSDASQTGDDETITLEINVPEDDQEIENDKYQEQPKSVVTALIKVNVTGPAKGRYRIGKHFTRETQTLEVTKDEFAALSDDPELAVTFAVTD